jgi:hypothetical protein
VLTQREVTSEEARVDRNVQRALKGANGRLLVKFCAMAQYSPLAAPAGT